MRTVDCKIEVKNDTVVELLEESIKAFCEEIDKVNQTEQILTIDDDCEDNEGKPYFKVIHEKRCDAHAVYLETIIEHYRQRSIAHLVKALKTGEFMRVYGVTRIVGYFSRIPNWNKSKANIFEGKIGGELGDRMKGNYWSEQRTNTGTQPVGV